MPIQNFLPRLCARRGKEKRTRLGNSANMLLKASESAHSVQQLRSLGFFSAVQLLLSEELLRAHKSAFGCERTWKKAANWPNGRREFGRAPRWRCNRTSRLAGKHKRTIGRNALQRDAANFFLLLRRISPLIFALNHRSSNSSPINASSRIAQPHTRFSSGCHFRP